MHGVRGRLYWHDQQMCMAAYQLKQNSVHQLALSVRLSLAARSSCTWLALMSDEADPAPGFNGVSVSAASMSIYSLRGHSTEVLHALQLGGTGACVWQQGQPLWHLHLAVGLLKIRRFVQLPATSPLTRQDGHFWWAFATLRALVKHGCTQQETQGFKA